MSDDTLDTPLEVVETTPDIMDQPTEAGIQPTTTEYPQLKDYFAVESPTDAQKEKFAEIWEYFGEESKSIGDLLYKMRTMESRLGSPALGESRLQKMYNYVKITRQIKDSEKQRDALLR